MARTFIKRRLSELTGEAACNQEEAGGLEQRLHNKLEPVVAQRQAPVLQDQVLLRSTGQRCSPKPDACGRLRLWMRGSAPKARHRSRLGSASYPLLANTVRMRVGWRRQPDNAHMRHAV